MKDSYDWQMLPSGAFRAVVPSTNSGLHTYDTLGYLSLLDRRVETAQDCELAREILDSINNKN
jgi:hypothetical protein